MAKMFLLLLFCGLAHAQALSGRVTSAEEGAMEGVLVSARQAGSSVTITVVSDAQGRYSFPASRLQAGTYSLGIRAAGYELGGPATATVLPQGTTLDLKLAKASNVAAQLSNAEWIASVPGTHSRKRGRSSTASAATRWNGWCARRTTARASCRPCSAWRGTRTRARLCARKDASPTAIAS